MGLYCDLPCFPENKTGLKDDTDNINDTAD